MATVKYIRVSSADQNTDRQLLGIEADKTYTDKLSGSTRKRPALEAMLDYVREGDTIHVHSIDRLGRDYRDMVNITTDLYEKGVTIHFKSENLTLSQGDHTSKLIFHIFSGIAESERARIRERQAEGIAVAKAKGKRFGPPIKATDEVKEDVKRMVAEGMSKAKVAKMNGISRTKVYQIIAK